MDIVILGKPGCKNCEAAKEKFRDKLRLPYRFVNLQTLGELWDSEKELVRQCMAEYELRGKLPLIRIKGLWYDYSEAMKCLKRKR